MNPDRVFHRYAFFAGGGWQAVCHCGWRTPGRATSGQAAAEADAHRADAANHIGEHYLAARAAAERGDATNAAGALRELGHWLGFPEEGP